MMKISGGIGIPKNWTKKNEILRFNAICGVHISERRFRKNIQEFNMQYDGREHDYYVVHNNRRGYKITQDVEEIKQSIIDNDKRAFTMLKQTRRIRKLLGMKNQVSLFEGEQA